MKSRRERFFKNNLLKVQGVVRETKGKEDTKREMCYLPDKEITHSVSQIL